MTLPSLPGRRVLVVEDEPLVAMLVQDILTDAGCVVVGPAAHLSEALRLARNGDLDAAVLDVNLSGDTTYPVAELLRDRAIPFVFSTGYGESGIRPDFAGRPTIRKPFDEKVLLARVAGLLEREAEAGSRDG